MRVDLKKPEQEVIRLAAESVAAGGVVLHPSDTIYGLGCDPFNPAALNRLFALKGRGSAKGVLVLIPGLDLVESLVDKVPEELAAWATRFWPGPLTLLLPAAKGLPQLLVGQGRKIGVRCPDSAFLQAWMRHIPGPVVSTSANLSGQPPPSRLKDLRELFEGRVDLFLEAGQLPARKPSTVVDLCTSPARIVRRGAGIIRVELFLFQTRGG